MLTRQTAKAAREGIPAEQRPILSAQACGRLVGLPEVTGASVVLGYFATDAELDPAGAIAALRGLGATIALPRIVGPGALTIHQVSEFEGLEHGPFGLRQPAMGAPAVPSSEVRVVLVPGVAFDVRGARIGYGGGYYDRLLASMPQATCIGLAFDEQLVGTIEHEPHDHPMHTVVTPTRVIRCSKAGDSA